MQGKPFYYFVAPSVALMLIFIATPLVSVFFQSFYVTSEVLEIKTIETCSAGFSGQICVEEEVYRPILDEHGLVKKRTEFVGLGTYKVLLDTELLSELWEDGEATLSDWVDTLSMIDFFRALRFTLTFTLVTLPLVIFLGLLLALSVNRVSERIRGGVIFVSLLPFIITPVIGAISIKWLFIGDGILTAFLEYVLEEDIAVFANGWAIEGLMLFYRVWHVTPFAFVVFYAGLQTVDKDIFDAAIVDGANRMQRLWYVVIPHLMPLIVFVSLIHLMDSFRVFEEIIGFSSQAHRISLQWLTYDFLTPDGAGNRAISRASASSMLTMVGIIVLLFPVLRKTWKDYKATSTQ